MCCKFLTASLFFSNVSLCPCPLQVLSTASDPLLGGRDFDNILRDYFGAEFLVSRSIYRRN